MNIRNIDNEKFSQKNGYYGGLSGFKEGLVIDGEDWLIKYPKNASYLERHDEMLYTNDAVSEYLGSHVYETLGFPVHETMLAERRGKIVVACKDFIDEDKRQKLMEIRTIKNAANEKLSEILERNFNNTGSSHIVDLEEIFLHIKYNDILNSVQGLKERFFDMLVIDAFINNSDRNNGNWGIIREPGKPDVLAPIFDNGGSFNGKTPDSRLEKQLSDKNIMANGIWGGMTVFGENEKAYSVKKLFSRNPDEINPEIINGIDESIIRNVPLIEAHMTDIVKIIDDIPAQACSDVRKEFYKKSLEMRLNLLLKPLYKQIELQARDRDNDTYDDRDDI